MGLITREELLDQYNKYHHKIAAKNLYRRLKKYNILLKHKVYCTEQDLRNAYFNEKLSILQLATKFKCSTYTINRLFRKYNIIGRSYTEAGLLRSKEIQEQMHKQWQDSIYRTKMTRHYASLKEKMQELSKNQLGRISNIQKILYSILDDLNIKYEQEKKIGFWTFDCLLTNYNIIIECQGNYWHNQPEAITKDRQKSTYLKNFPQYTLRYIWEHEFKCKNRIYALIKYWTGLQTTTHKYDLDDIIIKEANYEEATLLISKYHYAERIWKSSKIYGAYLYDVLIAICVFGPITRKESADKLNIRSYELLELTRFCIHPEYSRRNLASWFISKCVKNLKRDKPNIKMLISFADTTYNHYGIIYKASNWKLDGITKPSYWYVDKDGFVIHKKTLWDHAQKLNMTEIQYATTYGYTKVIGKEKFRYILQL